MPGLEKATRPTACHSRRPGRAAGLLLRDRDLEVGEERGEGRGGPTSGSRRPRRSSRRRATARRSGSKISRARTELSQDRFLARQRGPRGRSTRFASGGLRQRDRRRRPRGRGDRLTVGHGAVKSTAGVERSMLRRPSSTRAGFHGSPGPSGIAARSSATVKRVCPSIVTSPAVTRGPSTTGITIRPRVLSSSKPSSTGPRPRPRSPARANAPNHARSRSRTSWRNRSFSGRAAGRIADRRSNGAAVSETLPPKVTEATRTWGPSVTRKRMVGGSTASSRAPMTRAKAYPAAGSGIELARAGLDLGGVGHAAVEKGHGGLGGPAPSGPDVRRRSERSAGPRQRRWSGRPGRPPATQLTTAGRDPSLEETLAAEAPSSTRTRTQTGASRCRSRCRGRTRGHRLSRQPESASMRTRSSRTGSPAERTTVTSCPVSPRTGTVSTST